MNSCQVFHSVVIKATGHPVQINALLLCCKILSNNYGSYGANCNCISPGNCAYSHCSRCNPDCCAFGVGKHKETLEDNSDNSSSGSSNGGFGGDNRGIIAALGTRGEDKEECVYECNCDGSCKVSYTLQKGYG